MNDSELLFNDEADLVYSSDSVPSSWSSFNDCQMLNHSETPTSFFSSNLLDTLKQEDDFMHLSNTSRTIHPLTIPDNNNHSPTRNITSSPLNNNYDNTSLFHATFKEDEKDKNLNHTCINQIEEDIKCSVHRYVITKQDERKITILTSKVAQKSYGSEKRFLCPPPYIILSGSNNWWSTQNNPPNVNIQLSGDQPRPYCHIDWYKEGILINQHLAATYASQGDILVGNCLSKQLHISDTDEKRKSVQAHVSIQLDQSRSLGTFDSKPIKVIRKPSKKRQSAKDMELCIHNGSTVALFNRTRSQAASTKYLGVSSQTNNQNPNTCFVARTTSWDPFLIWIVDLTRSPDVSSSTLQHAANSQYPPPPAIAVQNPKQPLVLHYNQLIVLQCVSTGLISPVMVIRRADKGSMVMGGNRVNDPPCSTGGEYGDEALGDPVSQLHKVAFQIVQDFSKIRQNKQNHKQSFPLTQWTLPQVSSDVQYLACLNEVIGTHVVAGPRTIVSSFMPKLEQEDAQISRKRRLSHQYSSLTSKPNSSRRVNSLNDELLSSDTGHCRQRLNGDCWAEDVSDVSIWAIVSTDSVTFTFWTPPCSIRSVTAPITPFPMITDIKKISNQSLTIFTLILSGENFKHNVTVWFGDIQSPTTRFESDKLISCIVPDYKELQNSLAIQVNSFTSERQLPLLLVRTDGVIYNTRLFYSF
ncbi:hypothetical protein G6F64_003946 [Rhizopus arrhizus]|uniref:LAG1-DNAbind-domain-containing protein n=1 Tax=Rhizopus oryzae TaxID=64495 RepID=A0A9P7BUT2_RHIOR|nr:hypothetical protein G6F64_003946 [Rhizopus arrhizus]